jgi:hypothetical protein
MTDKDIQEILKTKQYMDDAREELLPKADMTDMFDTAMKTLTQDRGADYGPPHLDFARAARLKDVVAECEDPELRHVMEMICVKLARLIHSPEHLDSWLDIAGYARTACMVIDERQDDGR